MSAYPRSVQDWFLLITEHNDLRVIRQLFTDLDSDEFKLDGPRHQHLLNLITAIRLDQMAKEGG
jgi:hypothetical protein